MTESHDLHKLDNKSKLHILLANAFIGEEKPDAVVVTDDMIPQAIRKDINRFTHLYFTSRQYGKFRIDRIDLECSLVWFTEKNERIERRFSDLFKGKLANCPRCSGKLFRFGPYWRCRECEWNNVPQLGILPMPAAQMMR